MPKRTRAFPTREVSSTHAPKRPTQPTPFAEIPNTSELEQTRRAETPPGHSCRLPRRMQAVGSFDVSDMDCGMSTASASVSKMEATGDEGTDKGEGCNPMKVEERKQHSSDQVLSQAPSEEESEFAPRGADEDMVKSPDDLPVFRASDIAEMALENDLSASETSDFHPGENGRSFMDNDTTHEVDEHLSKPEKRPGSDVRYYRSSQPRKKVKAGRDTSRDTPAESVGRNTDDRELLDFRVDDAPDDVPAMPEPPRGQPPSRSRIENQLWVDETENHTIERQRREEFQILASSSVWRKILHKHERKAGQREEEDRILPEDMLEKKGSRVRFWGKLEKSSGKITSVKFHPWAAVLATLDRKDNFRLFEVGEGRSECLQALNLHQEKLHDFEFLSEQRVALVGRTNRIHVYDLERSSIEAVPVSAVSRYLAFDAIRHSPDRSTGHGLFAVRIQTDQTIMVFDERTMRTVGQFRGPGSQLTQKAGGMLGMTSDKMPFCWSGDGKLIWSFDGRHGYFAGWDTRTRRCFKRIRCHSFGGRDVACMQLAAEHLFVGSRSGVVEAYQIEDMLSSEGVSPLRPVAKYESLTTDINGIASDPSGSYVALYSAEKAHQVRLVDMATLATVPNWPGPRTRPGYVTSAALSNSSLTGGAGCYLAMGTLHGYVSLHRCL